MLTFLFVTIGLFNLIMAVFVENVMENTRQRRQEERCEDTHVMESRLRILLKRLIGGDNTLLQVSKTNSDLMLPNLFRGAIGSMRRFVVGLFFVTAQDDAAKVFEDDNDIENIVVTPDVFDSWLGVPEFRQMLELLEISTSNPRELFDVLDADMSGELEIDELVVGLMSLRGPTQKSHTVASLLYLRVMQQMVRDFHEAQSHCLSTILTSQTQQERRQQELFIQFSNVQKVFCPREESANEQHLEAPLLHEGNYQNFDSEIGAKVAAALAVEMASSPRELTHPDLLPETPRTGC